MPQTSVILQLGMVLACSCQPWGVGSWCFLLSLGLPHPTGTTCSTASCMLEIVMFHLLWYLE